MAVVALGAVRSCGVTTCALALAATWPEARPVLLAELDPAGGTLAAAAGLAPEPGLVSLAAAARRDGDPGLVWQHCQTLPGGVPVLAGPASADQARSALSMLAGLLDRLGEVDADAVLDCGRLASSSAHLGLLGRADRTVLVARPHLADLHALATFLDAHRVGAAHPGLVLVGDGPYPDDEVAEALGVAVLARLPADATSAAALVAVPASARELRRAPLVRSARSLADRLAGEMPAAVVAAAAHPPSGAVRHVAGLRLLRPWRAVPAMSTNGTGAEEVRE